MTEKTLDEVFGAFIAAGGNHPSDEVFFGLCYASSREYGDLKRQYVLLYQIATGKDDPFMIVLDEPGKGL